MNIEWLSALRLRCRYVVKPRRRQQLDRDLEDELQFHLATLAEQHRSAGVDGGEAEFLARRKFGNPTRFQEVCSDMWTFRWLEVMRQDIRYVTRTLLRSAGFSAAIIVTLALGIGACTAIFSVANAVLLRAMPFKNPGQLYRLRTRDEHGLPTGLVGPRHMTPLLKDHPPVEAAAWGFFYESSLITKDGASLPLSEYRASEQFFRVFNEPMTLGRGFQPGDDFDKTVLSYAVWKDAFHADPRIVGSVVLIGGTRQTIIGVAGRGFEFPHGAQVWTKIYTGPGVDILTNLEGYVRLRPGYAGDWLKAQMAVIQGQIGRDQDGRQPRFVVLPLLEDVVGNLRSTVLMLSAATAILLLIACLNVANLLFTRGVMRTREIAVRGALGAGRGRVVGQLMTESLVLCFLGGLLGSGLAFAAVRILRAIGPKDLPRLDTVSVDSHVLLFAAGCILLTAVLVGLAPALRLARIDLRSLINESGRTSSAGPSQHRLFAGLVIAEISLAIVLVIQAGLLVRSYARLTATDPGFNSDRMLMLTLNPGGRVDLRGRRLPDGKVVIEGTGYLPVARFYQQLSARLRALPGVRSVGAMSSAPLQNEQLAWDGGAGLYSIYGDPSHGGSTTPGFSAFGRRVTPEFFGTFGIRPVAGRLLESTDRRGGPAVAVVNQAFVHAYLADRNPLGQRINLPAGDSWRYPGVAYVLGERLSDQAEIVGVVPDIKYAALSEPSAPSIYFPHEQFTVRRMVVTIRTSFDNPGSLIPTVRRELAAMDPTIPPQFAVYSDVISASVARQRIGAALLSVFAVVALILAAVGIYGLMSYSVTQRSGEIAVRSALGASAGEVLGMIVRRGLVLAAAGIVAGVVGAVALRQVIASQLYEVSALDLRVFVLVPLALLAVALLSSYLPARRAARINPAEMLKSD